MRVSTDNQENLHSSKLDIEKTLIAIDKKYEDDKIELINYYEMKVKVENLNSNLNE